MVPPELVPIRSCPELLTELVSPSADLGNKVFPAEAATQGGSLLLLVF